MSNHNSNEIDFLAAALDGEPLTEETPQLIIESQTLFPEAGIARLKKAGEALRNVDESSTNFKKYRVILADMPTAQLKQICEAKIYFLSGVAGNIVDDRETKAAMSGMIQEEVLSEEELIEEASAEFHKAHTAGLKLPLDKLKNLHAEAHKKASHHWKQYQAADSIGSQSPETVSKKIEHGALSHKFTRYRDGLEQALKDRNEKPITESEEPKGIRQIKGHGNNTLIFHGEVGSMKGHVAVIPHVDVHTLESDPNRTEHHAYATSWRKSKRGIPHTVTHRLGMFHSHDAAVDAIKKFHKID